jgi:hypothetical protein
MENQYTLANLQRKAEQQDKQLKIDRKPIANGFMTKVKLE